MRLFIITIFTFLTLCTEVFASSVFITGGNQGIGFGFVKYYLKEGYKVYATYRLEEKSTALLKIKNDNLVLMQVDFENPDSALRHIKDVLKNDPLDILILNAGYFADKANKFGDLKSEDMQRSFTINTIFPLLLAQELKENIHTSKETKEYAEKSRIVIHYLPTYSPNLNLIERLWKIMHEYVSNNKFYLKRKEFVEAVKYFFDITIHEIKDIIQGRITDNFEKLNTQFSF